MVQPPYQNIQTILTEGNAAVEQRKPFYIHEEFKHKHTLCIIYNMTTLYCSHQKRRATQTVGGGWQVQDVKESRRRKCSFIFVQFYSPCFSIIWEFGVILHLKCTRNKLSKKDKSKTF